MIIMTNFLSIVIILDLNFYNMLLLLPHKKGMGLTLHSVAKFIYCA